MTNMEITQFINNFRTAFGEKALLPIGIWYSETPVAATIKKGGCIFKHLDEINNGQTISLTGDNIGCGGGKFYCGYSDMPEFVPNFVSQKEHYKKTPEDVLDFIEKANVQKARLSCLNLARIDKLESFDNLEGLLFLATPDVLSGLISWTFYDRNELDVVSTVFSSGCGSAITWLVNENAAGGYRSFLGFFDPSVRPYVGADILSFSIPMSRFRVMYETMPQSCLFDTHAWAKVKERIGETNP